MTAKFSLYRALGIKEIPLWTDEPQSTPYYYQQCFGTVQAAKQVWAPALEEWSDSFGELLSPDYDTIRLRRVLRDANGERVTVTLRSSELDPSVQNCDLKVAFANMNAAPGDHFNTLRTSAAD